MTRTKAFKEDYKTQHWTWGGDDPEMFKRDPAVVHAFHVPGQGWYGGFPPDVAKFIADTVNFGIRFKLDQRESVAAHVEQGGGVAP